MVERHGCIPRLSCESRGMFALINVQFWGRNVMDTESLAALSEVEESFTVSDLRDRNCEEEDAAI